MHPVSGYIMCLNETRTIEMSVRCLSTYVDDIFVLDGGSADNTLDILLQLYMEIPELRVSCIPQNAPRYGKGHTGEGWNQSWRRNYCLENCKHDWVFTIDADESIEMPANYLRETDTALKFPRYNLLNETTCVTKVNFHHGLWYPDYQTRYFNREDVRYNDALRHCIPCRSNGTGAKIQAEAGNSPHHIWHYHQWGEVRWAIDPKRMKTKPITERAPMWRPK